MGDHSPGADLQDLGEKRGGGSDRGGTLEVGGTKGREEGVSCSVTRGIKRSREVV